MAPTAKRQTTTRNKPQPKKREVKTIPIERYNKKTGKTEVKEYVPVSERILSFREQHPNGSIVTEDYEMPQELIIGAKWEEVRTERNKLLSESDWTQNQDVPETTRNAWTTYRQALRDLPTTATPTLDSDGDLDKSSVAWPDKP